MAGGNPNHDDLGRFSSGFTAGGPVGRARAAIDWVKSPEARALVAKLAAPENVKAAATFAVQGALFKIAGVNDPGVDAIVRHAVHSLANDLHVTTAHARNITLAVVRSMLKRGVKE